MRLLIYALLLISIPALVVIVAGFLMGEPILVLPAVVSISFAVAPFFAGLLYWYSRTRSNPDPDQDPDHH